MTKLDAYQTLSMALKVTDDLPDPKALKDKIGLLAQFIQRDLAAVLPTEEPDNAMVTKALILLASLLWREQQVPYDFAQFFLEFSISALELGDLPKDVAKHIMFILGRQNFSSKLMSVDRVSRILNAVHRILLHYSGKSIVLGRHQVYLKLMKQARSTVIARLCWIEDTFSDMVNTTKEVRGDIIRIALELSFLAGTDPKTSKSFIELFARSHEESGGSYAEYYGNKLTTMTKAKQDVAVVPQIWTVAILLLRSKPNQLAQWQFWKPLWLQVLQKCFNSNDQEVRGHAITAWNRLVFAVQPDENTPPAMTGMLLQPFIGQLKPRPDKPPKPVTQFTYGGICNLLYYALRPSASFAQLDLHWDTYVAPLMSCLIHVDKRATNEPISPTQNQRLNYAIAIMQALLAAGSSSKPSVWLIDRAMSDERIRAEELPPIDPKWVRKNNERVLAILHPILRSSFLELHVYRGGIRQLWTNFLHCIALAGAKEIKVSQETLTCIARMFAIASDVWRNCPCDYIDITYREPNEFLWSVEFFFEEMVSKLGILPFLEKKIAVDSYARFSIAATPSTNLRTARTPLQCLVTLFTLSGGCKHNTTPLIGSFGKLFDPFHRKNMASQMELCDELFGALPIVGSNHDERNIDAVWCSLAGMYGLALVNGVPESETKPVGVFIRSYLKVLEYGLISLNQDVTNSWTDLFWAVDKSVDEKLGAGGRALGLVDPLAQSLKDHYRSTDHESFLKLFNTVLERSEYPTDAKSLQAARLKLWGPSSSTQTSTTVDPYKHLYRCINFFLLKSVDAPRHEEALSLIRQTSYLLRRCPSECFSTLLLSIGDGLALWIEDARYEAASKTSDLLGVSDKLPLEARPPLTVLGNPLENVDDYTQPSDTKSSGRLL